MPSKPQALQPLQSSSLDSLRESCSASASNDNPSRQWSLPEMPQMMPAMPQSFVVTEDTVLQRYWATQTELFTRWMITLSRGISGRTKILLYDVKILVQWGGILTSPLDGTILTFDWSNASFIAVLVVGFSVVFFVVEGSVAPEDVGTIETESIVKLTGIMNKVVPFVLGIYLSVALTRWWSMRHEGLGKLFCAIADTCMLVACILPGERHTHVRVQITKWTMASIYLLVKAARGQSRIMDMHLKGLLSQEDMLAMEDMDSFSRPMVCWQWVMRLSQEVFCDANGPMPYSVQYARLCDLCADACESIDLISMYLQTQLPFIYVHLITLLVDMNNVLFIMKCGVISAVALMTSDYQALFSEMVSCTCVPMLYRGLLSISYVIHDPFGEEILDFPVGGYASYVADCVNAVLKAQERFPGVPDDVYAEMRESIGKMKSKMEKSGSASATAAEQKRPNPDEEEADWVNVLSAESRVFWTFNDEEQKAVEQIQSSAALSHPLPDITNAKDAAAVAAAGNAADVIAKEMHRFAERFADEMAVVNASAAKLREAIKTVAERRDQEVIRLCRSVFPDHVATCGGDSSSAPPPMPEVVLWPPRNE